MSDAHAPPAPGIGARRKSHPKLPLSAFSPPNSGTSEKFPLPPSPSTVHPASIVDANVTGDLGDWHKNAAPVLASRKGAIVLAVKDPKAKEVESSIQVLSKQIPVLSVLVPGSLDGEVPTEPLPSSGPIPLSVSAVFKQSTPQSLPMLKWLLSNARAVDIELQKNITEDEALYNSFEELISKATEDLSKPTPIVLSNLLPPPHDLTLPIVKLMNHPMYRAFQGRVAALSLTSNVYVKFLPPEWGMPTPASPAPGSEASASKEQKEWKRRIKMFLGPVLEAFGYQRIIFGSSPASGAPVSSTFADWYEIVRESVAELGLEQEAVDAVFATNATKVYGSA